MPPLGLRRYTRHFEALNGTRWTAERYDMGDERVALVIRCVGCWESLAVENTASIAENKAVVIAANAHACRGHQLRLFPLAPASRIGAWR